MMPVFTIKQRYLEGEFNLTSKDAMLIHMLIDILMLPFPILNVLVIFTLNTIHRL